MNDSSVGDQIMYMRRLVVFRIVRALICFAMSVVAMPVLVFPAAHRDFESHVVNLLAISGGVLIFIFGINAGARSLFGRSRITTSLVIAGIIYLAIVVPRACFTVSIRP